MRSARVTPNTVATPSDYNALVNDSSGAAVLLAHQMYGTIALPTNPSNTQTLTLDINGTNVVITFVSSIGSTAGNVLIGASAAATAANLTQLLLNPTISNTTQVAIGLNTSTNVTLVNYVCWSLSGTSIVASSYNSILYAPATNFSASTTATGGSYTANTMKVYVEPVVVYVNGTEIYFAGAATSTVTAPSSHPRIDVLSMDNTGTLNWTTGSENVSPSAPTYPANQLPICELYNVVGETALYDNANQTSGQGYILNDVRPFLMYPINLAAVPDSIVPSANNTYNLGSASFQWNNIYAGNAVFVNGLAMAGHFGGTGTSGALTHSSGTTTISASNAALLKLNYTSISITGTAYVQFTNPHTNGTIIIVKCQGSVTLTSSATPMLDASGMGATGATNGTTGNGSTGNQPNSNFFNATDLAGNGGTNTQIGGTGGSSKLRIINTDVLAKFVPLICGSGGGSGGGGGGSGGGGGAGGIGGGSLYVECGGALNFTTASGISVAGTAGSVGTSSGSGGGGGSGGMFIFLYATLTSSAGTVTVSGGAGGAASGTTGTSPSGGGGGGGATLANVGVGGNAGAGSQAGGAGGNGTSLIEANQDFS